MQFLQTNIYEISFVDDDSLTLERLTEKLIPERNPQSEQLNTFCNETRHKSTQRRNQRL